MVLRPFRRSPAVAFLSLLLLPFAASTGIAASGTIFQDDFKGTLAPGWSWRRENPAHWRTGDQGLEVMVRPGNLWGRANNAENILVRPAPDPSREPLEITARIHNEPTGQWEQVNLVWYFDDSHMVKLGQELVSGKLCVVMGREEGDRTRTIGIVPLDAHRVELRLQVTDQRIHGQYRTANWPVWREVGDCEPLRPATGTPQISLQCYQGQPNVQHWARFESLVVHRLAAPPVRLEEQRAAEQCWKAGEPVPTPLALTGPAAPFRLEIVGRPPDSPDGKADADLCVFLHRDGSYGWTWDRRTLAAAHPNFAGLVLRGPQQAGLPLPLRFASLDSFAAEMEVVSRLDVDRGQHALALHLLVSDSATAGEGQRHRLSLWFDWQGQNATGSDFDDGLRRYAYAAGATSTDPGVAAHVYRLTGFRGAPSRVDLKALLADATRRLALDPARLHVRELGFGTEHLNGSKGRTLVRRLNWIVNGRSWATVPAASSSPR